MSEPGLILTPPNVASMEDDGLLTASEIVALKLDAELVVLSACNTAASDGRPRADGLSGLTRSFLSAGARNVLVTHWTIPSFPAVSVTTQMMAERSRQSQDLVGRGAAAGEKGYRRKFRTRGVRASFELGRVCDCRRPLGYTRPERDKNDQRRKQNHETRKPAIRGAPCCAFPGAGAGMAGQDGADRGAVRAGFDARYRGAADRAIIASRNIRPLRS